jgi:predicted CopG family antitoxin
MASCSSKPGPSGFKKRKYNPLCDMDEESISDMLNELNIDPDEEMDLEIEGETTSEELNNEKSESERVKQVARVLLGGKK